MPLSEEDAKKINDLIAEEIGCDETEITPNARLIDLGADSLDLVELAIRIEEEFEIPEISDDDTEKLETVKQVHEYVEKAKAKL